MQWHKRSAWVVLTAAALLWAAAPANAATYYVAQRDAAASDDNPGTEAMPWKTLGKAAQTAQAGDVVWIKVGTYIETLQIENSGTGKDPLRFEVFGDDPVFITSPKTQVKGWEKVAGTQKVYEADCPVSGQRTYGPPSPVLAVDGKSVPGRGGLWALGVSALKEVTDETVNRFVLTDEGKLRLNIGGDDPDMHEVEVVPRNFTAVRLKGSYIILRGLQMVDVGAGVINSGEHNLIEDCVVRGAWNDFVWDLPFVHDGAYAGVFRRCTVVRGFRGAFTGGGRACVVEECLAVHTGGAIPNRLSPEDIAEAPGWEWGCAYHLGSASHCLHRYNIATDSTSFGWWSDIHCYQAMTYGNAYARSGTGIYNEALCHDATHMYNVCIDNINGFIWRFCDRLLGQYNYIADNETGVGVWGRFTSPGPTDNIFRCNLVQRNVRAVSIQRATHVEGLDGRDVSAVQNEITGRQETAYTDRNLHEWDVLEDNIYTVNPEGVFLRLREAGVPYWPEPAISVEYKTLAEYQRDTGRERGSEQRDASMEEFGLSLYTVRVPWSKYPDRPVPIVGNPARTAIHANPLPAVGDEDPYFWKPSNQPFEVQPSDAFGFTSTGGVSLRWGRRPYFPKGEGPRLKLDAPAIVWLTAEGKGADQFEHPAGWWSPSLPTVPGAKIHFSFLYDARDLEAPTEDGIVAWVRFSSATNQHVTRQFVLGKNDAGEFIGQGPTKGTFSWRRVEATLTAPERAERFAVFFGIRPSKGVARFADIDLQTEPGEHPDQAQAEEETGFKAPDLEQEVLKFIREQADREQ